LTTSTTAGPTRASSGPPRTSSASSWPAAGLAAERDAGGRRGRLPVEHG
jgi:hypothetical protein